MNLWILKYDSEPFNEGYIHELEEHCSTIPQLMNRNKEKFSKGNFHFLSFTSEGIPKKYNQINKDELKGYSGLVIDKSDECNDKRSIEQLEINPEKFYGQFALYELTDSFACYGDVLGFHKIFYGQKEEKIFVSNSFAFLKKINVFEVNTEKMLKDLCSVKFGIFPGYSTDLKNVFTLPEYGRLELTKSGNLQTRHYKEISELLQPQIDFETKFKEVLHDYKTIAKYLRKYHSTAVGLSGGFDGRLLLNMFYGTTGKRLETFTYNRAGNLDLYIARRLSKKAKVYNEKLIFNAKEDGKELKVKVTPFKDYSGDAFRTLFQKKFHHYFKDEDEFKVVLNGNGGDTEWEFGEKRIADIDKSTIYTFINDYSKKLAEHPIVKQEVKEKFALEFKNYFTEKYGLFSENDHWQQHLASAFFHLERFRSGQAFDYSQYSNNFSDIYAPFAIESFNQLVFLANKNQLQRGLREGIHYRLSKELTNNNIPFAPILTSAEKNEHGKNFIQNIINKIVPYLPKIIWKLNGGDTSRLLNKLYETQTDKVYRDYILQNKNSIIFNSLKKDKILKEVEKDEYAGQFNNIGSMIKTINDSKTL